ncbi:hypothetical protein LINPERPRIM_LOCUS30979 [Linum perenne]
MPPKGKGKQVSKQGQSSTHSSDIGDALIDVDHSKFIISEVRHQGISNTCWAIVTTVTVKAFVNKFGGTDKVYQPKSDERDILEEHAITLIDYGTEKKEDGEDQRAAAVVGLETGGGGGAGLETRDGGGCLSWIHAAAAVGWAGDTRWRLGWSDAMAAAGLERHDGDGWIGATRWRPLG